VRLFIAIEVPGSIKKELAALQVELKKAGADVSWTRPENIHLTLKFLGEVAEERLDDVLRATTSAAGGFGPARLALSGIGVFDERRPRVVWAALRGDAEVVSRLWSDLDERLGEVGFARESRAFRPHLTIGRFKSPRRARELIAIANGYSLSEVSFVASEIAVVQSKLHPAGAQYNVVKKAALGH
jgi:2'-5' RNA ligase